MPLFDEIKEHLTIACCKRCERSSDVRVFDNKLWCAWCCKECEVFHKSVEVVSKEKFESLHTNLDGQFIDPKNLKLQPLRITSGPFGISGDFHSSTTSSMSSMPLSTIERILPELGEVRFLEVAFERDPFVPDGVERAAEHMAELGGVEGLAAFAPAQIGVDHVALDRAGADDRHLDDEVVEMARA